MIVKSIEIEKFRAFEHVSFNLGKKITVISGRNATQKTTVLGIIGQPFTISSKTHPMYGCKTIDGYNFRSQFREKFKISPQYDVIGETGKTHSMVFDLTEDELEYCIANYRTILSIQSMGNNPEVGLEKGTSTKVFAGVSDDTHDIFTNSAGEGNVVKIILAVLSFRRLKEQYGKNYKGGILLIDELDATLYGFSQGKLVEYLWKAAGDYRIQIVFTTHSPVILKCVNKYYRRERQEKGINLPLYAYDNVIVYLEPFYREEGKRTIMPQNISSTEELSRIFNDINLTTPVGESKIKIYCEDA